MYFPPSLLANPYSLRLWAGETEAADNRWRGGKCVARAQLTNCEVTPWECWAALGVPANDSDRANNCLKFKVFGENSVITRFYSEGLRV